MMYCGIRHRWHEFIMKHRGDEYFVVSCLKCCKVKYCIKKEKWPNYE